MEETASSECCLHPAGSSLRCLSSRDRGADSLDVYTKQCQGGRCCWQLYPMYVDRHTYEVNEEFTFVGEAYCDGVMDGEILERAEERLFLIR